jgi:hypothetical protein
MLREDTLQEVERQFASYRSWREGLGVQFRESSDEVRQRLLDRISDILTRSEEVVRDYRALRRRLGFGEGDQQEGTQRSFMQREIRGLIDVERKRDWQEYRQVASGFGMFDRVYCASYVNWWCDSDCERHLVTEYNLVRFYEDGTVISRRVEISEQRGSCGDSTEAYQPVPFPSHGEEALTFWIDRHRPETYSFRGNYLIADHAISLHLDSASSHDTRIDRWDLKYVAHDAEESQFLREGDFEGRADRDEISLSCGILLHAL